MKPLSRIRNLMILQAVLFIFGACLHSGWILSDHFHFQARIAETIITIILGVGLAMAFLRRPVHLLSALVAQTFALIGTLMGMTAIAVGIGPRSALDYLLHAAMLATLGAGLVETSHVYQKKKAHV